MEHGRFLAFLLVASILSQVNSCLINVEEIEDKVFLISNTTLRTIKGTKISLKNDNVNNGDLGRWTLDPQGMYECNKTDGKGSSTLQVYFRMCQNCVELDSATLAGLVVSDIIATLLLALGVYCFAGHETGRRVSSAADTQGLMKNDQLYQPLGDRKNDQYSSLGENWQQKK